ncbi:hypothetical protein MPSEU_000689000 [Mayamaea pseudoterrestris]|nr:hypothetical protein MPSEU_000689000 [Mayamaea pseudoterrestris]
MATSRRFLSLLPLNMKLRFPVASLLTCFTTTSSFTVSSAFVPLRASPFAISRSFMTSSGLFAGAASTAPFTTWTFDKPCNTMEWNEIVSAKLETQAGASAEALESADLVILGIMAPPREETDQDEEEDDDSEDKEEPPVSLSGVASEVDSKLGGSLTQLLTENAKAFKNGAKAGTTSPTLRTVGASPTRYIAMGLGATPKAADSDKNKNSLANMGATLGKAVAEKLQTEKKVKTVKLVLPELIAANAAILEDFSATFYATLYTDNRYRTGAKVKKVVEDLESVTIVADGGADVSATAAAKAIERGQMLAKGIFLAKDIVNAPHNVLNSLSLAETAKRIAKASGGTIQIKILGKNECEKLGMGAFLAVARGSETEPQFIHLTYKPPSGTVNKKIGIVGKGLLFDTGGYNIKTKMMELMKFDCGGAAAVLGAARAIGAMQPEGVEAHFFIAACENMVNEKAYVPSDILTAMNGKTIEVMNTDAEGRLTLADAIVYADKVVDCETIIELSTLTGACMAALGKGMAGVWTTDEPLAKEIEAASKSTGDKSWRMPMEQSYNEQLDSKFADMKNIGGAYGGAITAALFLQKFVSKKKPFAHIDIAGPVWTEKGATGYGTKLVAEWIQQQGATKKDD